MKWTDLQPGFCESSVVGPPEYVNAFTSLAMTFYGLMGLFMTQNHNIILRVTSAMLAVTGIGSVIYHWTLHTGWGQIDALPMLMSSYLGAYQAFDTVIYKKLYLDRLGVDNRGQTRHRQLYEQISGVLSLVFMALLAISLALSVTDDTAQYFSILFAIPEVLIAVSVALIRFVSHKDLRELQSQQDLHNLVGEEPAGTTKEDALHAFRIMYFGFGSAIVAAVFWFVTESLCEQPELFWLRWLFAHGIWHIAISAGMYFLMQFLVFIYSFNVGKEPYFLRGTEWYEKVFYTLVPTVRLRNAH